MKTMRILSMSMALVVIVGLTGCAMFNSDGTVHYTRTTTIGRELVDLEEAKDKGLISDAEYYRLREEIIKVGPVEPEKWPMR